MKKVIFAFLILAMVLPACVRSKAKCKADVRKAKKNNIGWKY